MRALIVEAVVAAAIIANATINWFLRCRDIARARSAFEEWPHYCTYGQCGARRQFIRIVGDLVEHICPVHTNTRVIPLDVLLYHDCCNADLVPVSPERKEDGFTVQNLRCRVCDKPYESVDGMTDIVLS